MTIYVNIDKAKTRLSWLLELATTLLLDGLMPGTQRSHAHDRRD